MPDDRTKVLGPPNVNVVPLLQMLNVPALQVDVLLGPML
jgi:hypothetical protein